MSGFSILEARDVCKRAYERLFGQWISVLLKEGEFHPGALNGPAARRRQAGGSARRFPTPE